MKLILSVTALTAIIMSTPALAYDSPYKNLLGAGVALSSGTTNSQEDRPPLDMDEANIFITGTFGEIPQLAINATYYNAEGGYYRADAQYLIDANFSAHVGYAAFEHEAWVEEDVLYDDWTEKGIYFGVGYTFFTSLGETYTFARHNQSFDGFSTLGVRQRLGLSDRVKMEVGFHLNSEVANEARIGLLLKF